ncbi:MAG: phage tail protein [Myxococcales bacterium]|nr:phage tail protein [Myxococcales bacterium]
MTLLQALSGITQIEEPLPAYSFFVTLDPTDAYLPAAQAILIPTMAVGAFAEVKGLGGELEVMPYAEGGINDYVHQLPVRHSWGRLTLRRGVVRDLALWVWYRAGLTRSLGARRDGAIVLCDETGGPAIAWVFRGALAAKWMGPELNANQSAVAIDGLEIAHQGLEAVPLPPTTAGGLGRLGSAP